MAEFNPDKHPLLPGGEFIVCRNTFFTGKPCTSEANIWINREAREISRHYKAEHAAEHAANNNQVNYAECAVITRAAAIALVGWNRVDQAEQKDRSGLHERPFDAAPRYPGWMPVDGDAEATCLAASAAIAANAAVKNPALPCRPPQPSQ